MVDKAPIQVRLNEEDLAVLDRVVTIATARMAGIKQASRPEALRWAFLTGAVAIIRDAMTPEGLATLYTVTPAANPMPVPELPVQTKDTSWPQVGIDEAPPLTEDAAAQARAGKRRNSQAYRQRQKAKNASRGEHDVVVSG